VTWNIEEFRAYYNAMLHVNIKIMTSQQRWYLLLNFNNNKINFLFSCEIRFWSFRFRQFDVCQVNTAQSNTLVHSIVPNRWAKFGAKIFRHFWDIAIFVLVYFILPHPVVSTYQQYCAMCHHECHLVLRLEKQWPYCTFWQAEINITEIIVMARLQYRT